MVLLTFFLLVLLAWYRLMNVASRIPYAVDPIRGNQIKALESSAKEMSARETVMLKFRQKPNTTDHIPSTGSARARRTKREKPRLAGLTAQSARLA